MSSSPNPIFQDFIAQGAPTPYVVIFMLVEITFCSEEMHLYLAPGSVPPCCLFWVPPLRSSSIFKSWFDMGGPSALMYEECLQGSGLFLLPADIIVHRAGWVGWWTTWGQECDEFITASPAPRTVPMTHWGPGSSLFLGLTNLFGKGAGCLCMLTWESVLKRAWDDWKILPIWLLSDCSQVAYNIKSSNEGFIPGDDLFPTRTTHSL